LKNSCRKVIFYGKYTLSKVAFSTGSKPEMGKNARFVSLVEAIFIDGREM